MVAFFHGDRDCLLPCSLSSSAPCAITTPTDLVYLIRRSLHRCNGRISHIYPRRKAMQNMILLKQFCSSVGNTLLFSCCAKTAKRIVKIIYRMDILTLAELNCVLTNTTESARYIQTSIEDWTFFDLFVTHDWRRYQQRSVEFYWRC